MEIVYITKLTRPPDKIIHHIVGMRRIDQTELFAVGPRCASDAPRAGSFIQSTAGTINSAGAAAAITATRQP